jgi:hypothetical protein
MAPRPSRSRGLFAAAKYRAGFVYESIHKAVQYKNSGAIQIATNINEIDGITVGLKGRLPIFIQCRRK